jgi:hypothetical protein
MILVAIMEVHSWPQEECLLQLDAVSLTVGLINRHQNGKTHGNNSNSFINKSFLYEVIMKPPSSFIVDFKTIIPFKSPSAYMQAFTHT